METVTTHPHVRAASAPPVSRFATPWDRRLTPDTVLSARSPKVAALLARTEGEAGR